MTRRTIAVLAAVAVTAGLLGGCSAREPDRESLETAIPGALLDSGLGITEAEANTSTSGLSVSVFTAATFDRGAITGDELRDILQIVVDNTDVGNIYSVRILGLDGTTEEYDTLDLGAVGEELGFDVSASNPGDFVAEWDAVVEFLK